MKTTNLVHKDLSTEVIDLVLRLIALIPSPLRRPAMGDITLSLLDGKKYRAENVFGWNRNTVEIGMSEHKTGLFLKNDISTRVKPKTEVKHPELLTDIQAIMEPYSESESSLRTTLLYTNMTAKSVFDALIINGWTVESLPTVRTISNILNRQDYRLRTVAKTKVQKKQLKPMPSLKTSGKPTRLQTLSPTR